MNEEEILKKMLSEAENDFQYFSNPNKPIREQDVVKEFLSKLNVSYNDDEFPTLDQNNKVDVQFRDAMFQVKEIPDPNFHERQLHKKIYNSIRSARSLDDVSLVGDIHDIPPVTSIYELVFEKAKELAYSEKYINFKGQLDLLIHVTRTRASLIQTNEINANSLSVLGWRSISCINSKQAVVLSASSCAPTFISKNLGVVTNVNG